MSKEFRTTDDHYKVLWMHPAAAVGGASISLTELLKPLVTSKVSGLMITPAGSSAKRFSDLGVEVLTLGGLSQWDNTRFGRYKGFRWLILLRELAFLPASLRLLQKLRKRRTEFDLIHINEITLLPLGVLAKRLLKLPLVVHVRSLQSPDTGGMRSRWINGMLAHQADSVIAIDQSVRRTLPPELPVDVIHNVLQVDRSQLKTEMYPETRHFRIAMVGGLLALKGVYEFVEAASICKQRGLDIEFVIAGENARELKGIKGRLIEAFGFGRNVRADLEKMIAKYGLDGTVTLKGFVNQVGDLYGNIDLLCFPSYLDAAGRPVFEAAFFGVPSIVAVSDPPFDAIVDGVTGICIPPRDPVALADAIEKLYGDRQACLSMGQAARRLAESHYDPLTNAQYLLGVYRKVESSR